MGIASGRPNSDADAPNRLSRVRELFESATELEPERRTAFLEEECGSDLELRGAVQRMLIADARTSAPIDRPAFRLSALNVTNIDRARASIGPYRLERVLGEGGMGLVYLASRADKAFHKRVALKIMHRGVHTSELLQRFQQEREIVAALDHPNVARLLDGGSTDDGLHYFVMEYVEGTPITTYCNSAGLNVSDRIRLFLQVCDAVQYAHQKLIVHRDLKPGNMLVTRQGVVKLLDFGIAKMLEPAGSDTLLATSAGMRLMTPVYASPEQIRGQPITTASDVYSLGLVLYQLLTGRLPYRIQTPSLREIERIVCESEPARASTVIEADADECSATTKEFVIPEGKTTRLKRRLQGDLDNILAKTLQKDPARRFASVDLFVDDLQRHLNGLPVRSRPDSFLYRARKFTRRNRIGVAAAVLVAASLTGGLVVAVRERQRAEAAAAEAVHQRNRAESQAREARTQQILAEQRAQEAVAQEKRAQATSILEQIQRRIAQRRFNDVRQLANSLFDIHDLLRGTAGATAVRRLVTSNGLEYLNALASEAGSDRGLKAEIAAAYEKVGDVQGDPDGPNLGETDRAVNSYRAAMRLYEQLIAGSADAHQVHRRWWSVFLKLSAKLNDSVAYAPYVAHNQHGLKIVRQWKCGDTSIDETNSLWLSAEELSHRGDLSQFTESYRKVVERIDSQIDAEHINRARSETWPLLHIMLFARSGQARTSTGDEANALLLPVLEKAVLADPNEDRLRADFAAALLLRSRALNARGESVVATQLVRRSVKEASAVLARNRGHATAGFVLGSALLELSAAATRAELDPYLQYIHVAELEAANDAGNLEGLRVLYARLSDMAEILERRNDRSGAAEYRRRALRIASSLTQKLGTLSSNAGPNAPLSARQLFYGIDRKPNAWATPAADHGVSLRYSILRSTGDGFWIEVPAIQDFLTGDSIKIEFEVNRDSHLYVLARGTSGNWTMLHPQSGDSTFVLARTPTRIPRQAKFTFDRQPGIETVYAVVMQNSDPMLDSYAKSRAVPDAVMRNLMRSGRKPVAMERSGTARLVAVNERNDTGVFVSNAAFDDSSLITVIDLQHR